MRKTKDKTKENLLICRFSDSGRGFGFAQVIEGDEVGCEDVYIAAGSTRDAMTGDTVLVHRYRRGEPGFTRGNEGEVAKITERGNTEIIGTFFAEGAGALVRPDNEKLHATVRVRAGDTGGAVTGDKVAVRISDFPKRRRGENTFTLTGCVTAVFGKAVTREANYAAVLHQHGIPTVFPEEAVRQAEESSGRPIAPVGRTDLRHMPTLTIDGADAKDLDDAVSLTKTASGWQLTVHIADVSHYVTEGGAVDAEAYRRGTSVYFVDKVVPMLPTSLSNGACSLNGGEDRYALSAFITLNEGGEPVAYDFQKTLIRSDVRGVYSEVNDIFANGQKSPFAEKYAPVMDMLADMHTLYGILAGNAAKRGQLQLESTEAKILLDDTGLPTDIVPAKRGDAEKMIEQFMLSANVAAATFLTERGMPCLYRIHPDPAPEKMHAFALFAHNMDLDSTGIGEGVRPLRLSRLLTEAEEKGIAEQVSGVMLRSLSKAKYSESASPHYGLALPLYAHFTSPIRRYPDLFVHRAITAVLTGSRRPTRAAERARATSDAELRAVAAERQIEDLYMAQYASFHIGEEYHATVTSVCSFGVFARTDKLFEGLLPLESLFSPGARSEYDETRMTLRGRVGGEMRTYSLGDSLTVRVVSADIAAGQIDLFLADAPASAPTREEMGGRHSFHARPEGKKRVHRGGKPRPGAGSPGKGRPGKKEKHTPAGSRPPKKGGKEGKKSASGRRKSKNRG